MRIAVALSGGMDSTAAALLLKRQGHDVVGLHMLLHAKSESTLLAAQKAAQELGIPIYAVDLSNQFSEFVVSPFVEQYSKGLTPSPCPLCNRIIKMGMLFDHARQFGCERLATGHYAKIIRSSNGPMLLRGEDSIKDQSYFLFNLTEAMLDRTLFPLGRFTKTQIRKFLEDESISVAQSEESQELCFIPGDNYREFLKKKNVFPEPGHIVDSQGKILGEHQGITNFTVGQRRGLGICAPRPLYVIRIDAVANTVIVGFREETLRKSLRISRVNLFPSYRSSNRTEFQIKVRSTSKPVSCSVTAESGNCLDLELKEPQAGVAAGQAGVLYSGNQVIGGGWIEIPVHW
jgi:tRNA-uridine 2-sulfurtransferase